MGSTSPEGHEAAKQAAFGLAEAYNPEIVREIGDALQNSGYNDGESMGVAELVLGTTHLLLLAQARRNQGLPPIDTTSDIYPLPVVTADAVTALLAGYRERLIAQGLTSYEDLVRHNEWIAKTVKLMDYRIGEGSADRPTQAAEITAIALHAMLREQAAIDASEQQLGGGLLG